MSPTLEGVSLWKLFHCHFPIFQHSGNNRIFRKKCSQLRNDRVLSWFFFFLLGRDHLSPYLPTPRGAVLSFSNRGPGPVVPGILPRLVARSSDREKPKMTSKRWWVQLGLVGWKGLMTWWSVRWLKNYMGVFQKFGEGYPKIDGEMHNGKAY